MGTSNSSHRISSWWAFSLLILTVTLGSFPAARADMKVIPPVADGAEGGDLYYGLNSAVTFQNLFAASQLNGLPAGATITGLQFRLDSGSTSQPSSTSNFDVYLGPPTGATLGTSAAGNEGPGTVKVRSGALSFPADAFPAGGNPNLFGPVIGFNTPFTYTGGPLLVTLSYTDFTGGVGLDYVFSGVTGNDARQWLGYNGSTLDDSPPESALVMQLVYTVPEPTSVGIMAMAGMMVMLRRRRRGAPCGSVKR